VEAWCVSCDVGTTVLYIFYANFRILILSTIYNKVHFLTFYLLRFLTLYPLSSVPVSNTRTLPGNHQSRTVLSFSLPTLFLHFLFLFPPPIPHSGFKVLMLKSSLIRVKEDGVGRACDTNGGEEECIKDIGGKARG
jgi:hypothetical protein